MWTIRCLVTQQEVEVAYYYQCLLFGVQFDLEHFFYVFAMSAVLHYHCFCHQFYH